jgi:phthalate 3,4-dioxygenase ferredoxin reductase component
VTGVVIVGASLAGVRTAQALRTEGYAGPVVLIGAEPHAPYDRPPLSKQVLTGAWPSERAVLLAAEAAAKTEIDLRLGVPAIAVDSSARRVLLADGSAVGYDVLVVATGLSARPSPWPLESGSYLLRSWDDCAALRAQLCTGQPLVVVGAGFIGSEVAAAARSFGCEVTMVDPLPTPMARAVGPVLGEELTQLQIRHGVKTQFGTGVAGVEGRAGAVRVGLGDGSVLDAAAVVVGIGAVPNDGWLIGSGLRLQDGVVCDPYLRAVGAENVYAVGDICRWPHDQLGELVRVEHWTNAADQARVVATNIVHGDEPVLYVPSGYVWSDQYDWKVQVAGEARLGQAQLTVGELAGDGRTIAVHADARERVCAVVAVNWPRAFVHCRRMLVEQASIADTVDLVRGL